MGKRNNGKGTFVTLAPNKIVHKICIGKNSNGKPKFLSVTGTTKADCKRKMKARLDALNKSQNDINNIYKDTLTTLCKKHLASDISGAHILRRTCATRFYEQEPNIDWIASYPGDTPETVSKYYIAIRKKISEGGKTKNVVPLPRKRNNGVIALN